MSIELLDLRSSGIEFHSRGEDDLNFRSEVWYLSNSLM